MKQLPRLVTQQPTRSVKFLSTLSIVCNCISPMASRILSFKVSILSGLLSYHLSLTASHKQYSNGVKQYFRYSSFGCVAHSAVLLKPNVANILHGPIMYLDQNPHQTVPRFGCGGFSMYASIHTYMSPKWDNFACLHPRQDQNELHLKR